MSDIQPVAERHQGDFLVEREVAAQRAFLSFGTHLLELYRDGEVTQPPKVEQHPAYLAAEKFWHDAKKDLDSYADGLTRTTGNA